MRIALLIIIVVHGLIHLFGFLKAYGLAEFSAIQQPISRISGLFWLLAFVLFASTVVLLYFQSDHWWIIGLAAVGTSQILVIRVWADAKFGTLANVFILLACILAYAKNDFSQLIKKERAEIIRRSAFPQKVKLAEADLIQLPPVIRKWLTHAGAVGKHMIQRVHLTQTLSMRLKPESDNWVEGRAEQYFSVQPPAFHWNVSSEMNPFITMVGRDKFESGEGEMLIKLAAVIPVANAKNSPKTSQATLQRYLAEIVWFPTAALSEYIQWEQLDAYSAKATMEFNGTSGSGVFHFDENGAFTKFVAQRFMDAADTEPTQWTVSASQTEVRNGILIPVACEAAWQLPSGDWKWLKLTIQDLEYNNVEAL